MTTALILRLLILLGVFAGFYVFSQVFLTRYFNRRAENKAVNRRLQLLKAGITSDQVGDIFRRGVPDRVADDAPLTTRLYYKFQCMVRIADMRTEPRTFLAICLLAFAAITTLILLFAWFSGRTITIGVLELVVGVTFALTIVLPLMMVYRRKEKRRRKLLSLSELTGMEGDTITMQEIFRFQITGRNEAGQVQGQFEAAGIRPKFATNLQTQGITLDPHLFDPRADLEPT